VQLFEYRSIDEIQYDVLRHLLLSGETSSPRGMPTLEARAVSFTLADPRRRCVVNPERKWSLPLALGEACWHLSGATGADQLAYYAPIWKSFADNDGQIRGSCYGAKMFSKSLGASPWMRVQELLRADPSTRRAVLYFGDSLAHLDPLCSDAACATSLQFMIRQGQLDAIVCMRSNDAIWGLPYDVFLFTFLQELMATELQVGLGKYHHFAASLHLYEKHRKLASRIVDCGSIEVNFAMPSMENPEQVGDWLIRERCIRLNQPYSAGGNLSEYWSNLADVFELFSQSKRTSWSSALTSRPIPPYSDVLGWHAIDASHENDRQLLAACDETSPTYPTS
jgi:thymidylate synthase